MGFKFLRPVNYFTVQRVPDAGADLYGYGFVHFVGDNDARAHLAISPR
jgi:hypothetical protein